MSTGIELIAKERKRQIEEEGWSLEHDDRLTDGSLAAAAVCYATPERVYVRKKVDHDILFADPWLWTETWDKRLEYGDVSIPGIPDPSTYSAKERIDLLIKAGALIAAEIDRIQRNLSSIIFRPRGIGADTGSCFALKCEISGMLHNIAAFVDTKEDGEKIVQMFNGHGAYLDYRLSEPEWIQVKVYACPKHLPVLEALKRLTDKANVISEEMIQIAREAVKTDG